MTLRYLLDTNICIYIAKKNPQHVFNHFKKLAVGDVGMSVITYGELLYGIQKSHHIKANKNTLDQLIQNIPALSLPCEASQYYGETRSKLEKKGTIIGNNDLWIAAHALAANLILVTNNVKEFSRVSHLKIENWVEK